MKKKKTNPNCALCQSPFADAAEVMHEMQASDAEISEHCRVDLVAVQEHFRACASTGDADDDPEAAATGHLSDRKLQKLISDATTTYTSATALGNYVASSSALAVRLRALCEQNRRQELRRQQEEEKKDEDSGVLTIELMDQLIAEAEARRPAREEAGEDVRINNAVRSCELHENWPLPESIIKICEKRGWRIEALMPQEKTQ